MKLLHGLTTAVIFSLGLAPSHSADLRFAAIPNAPTYRGIELNPAEAAIYNTLPNQVARGLRAYLAYSYMAEKVTTTCQNMPSFDIEIEEINVWSPQVQKDKLLSALTKEQAILVDRDAQAYAQYLINSIARPSRNRIEWCEINSNLLFDEALGHFNGNYENFLVKYQAWIVSMQDLEGVSLD